MANISRLLISNNKHMNSNTIALSSNENILDVLNFNKIAEDVRDKAVELMGMAACQVRCLNCQHCSNMRCGNR